MGVNIFGDGDLNELLHGHVMLDGVYFRRSLCTTPNAYRCHDQIVLIGGVGFQGFPLSISLHVLLHYSLK